MTQPKRLTLIDGSGFIFRAFFALPKLTNSAGTPVGAVYGFVNMLQKLLRDAENNEVEDYMAVIFDAGRLTFRNEIYPEYKANRDEPPEELRPQFALVREATVALGLPAIELAGVEADDLIATYTRRAKEAGFDEVIIVSSDKDLMQLVDDNAGIHLFDAMKNKVIDAAGVEAKFSVPPHKVREVLALMGDSSDNIPGVPGIGPKTAAQLIQHFETMESLLARAEEEIPQKKRRESLMEYADQARLSYELVGLKEDCDLPQPLDSLTWNLTEEAVLRAFLQEMGFRKLLEKMGGDAPEPVAEAPKVQTPKMTEYTMLDEAGLAALLAISKEKGQVAVAMHEGFIALSVEAGRAGVFQGAEVRKQGAVGEGDLFGEIRHSGLRRNDVVEELFSRPATLKIGYDMKAMPLAHPFDDIALIGYCLNAGKQAHDFAALSQYYLQQEMGDISEVIGKGRSKILFAEAEPQKIADYLGQRADFSWRLWQQLRPQLPQQQLLTVYEKLERPLLPILAQMERRGILVDKTYLKQLSAEFNEHIARLEGEIYAAAGQEFTLGSPKQLGEVLFDRLGIPGGKRSKKSGQYATGVEVLEELAAQGYEIAAKVLSWRQYEKLRSTYTDALVKQINPQTGRVHTTFQQTVAATGRLSSTNPNLQNIPIRTEEGARIRKAFIAAPGHVLISADYSQIELRLLAELADMKELKQAFKNGEDIHAATASQMFGIPLAEMTSEYRRRAKTINFGIIYGISAHGLAVRLGIDRPQAAAFIEQYFEHYPGIRRYMEAKKQEAREAGYITTLFGRKVHIKGMADTNYNLRAFAERQAINAPLQGTAADIIKRAMIQVGVEVCGVGCVNGSASHPPPHTPHLLLQVHDELVFELRKEQAQEAAAQIQHIMQSVAPQISVPLKVDVGIGQHWGEIH